MTAAPRLAGRPLRYHRDMQPSVEEYLGHLSVERGASRHTLSAYGRDLTEYRVFLAGRGVAEVGSVSGDDVTAFVAHLRARGLAPSTVERKVAAIKGFHKFLVREGITSNHPTARLPLPKVPERLPDVVSIDEVDRLLGQPFPDGPVGLRDRAILETLYGCGLRVIGARRPRHDRHRSARRVRAGVRQGEQGAGRAGRRHGLGLARRISEGGQAPAQSGAQHRRRRVRALPEPARRTAFQAVGVRARAGRTVLVSASTGSTLTRCGTRSRRTCSRVARTYARSRRCSDMQTFPQLRSTRTWIGGIFGKNI